VTITAGSTILGLVSCLIKVIHSGRNSHAISDLPFHRDWCMTYALHHIETQLQQSINNFDPPYWVIKVSRCWNGTKTLVDNDGYVENVWKEL